VVQRILRAAPSAQDHKVVGIGDEPSAETLLKTELLPSQHKPAVGAERRGGRAACRATAGNGRMAMPGTDVIDTLVGIKPGSAVDAIRNRRPAARNQAQRNDGSD
jgi:hypothetical protein